MEQVKTSFNKHLKNTKRYSIELLRTEMTPDPSTEIENTSNKASILCGH